MSEENTTENTESTENVEVAPQGVTETDWKAEARKWEARAKAAKADVEDASKWREFEQNQKSDFEKLADELARTRAEATEASTKLLRLEIASRKGVPNEAVELLQGKTQEELEAAADKLMTLIADQSKQTPSIKPDSNQGKPIAGTNSTADQFASALSALL